MVVLTVNTGSSSVKLAAFTSDASGLHICGQAHFEADATDPSERLKSFMEQHALAQPQLIAHRVVHGGALLTSSRRIDAEVETEIERIAPLAPLHNPVALTWIRACRALLIVISLTTLLPPFALKWVCRRWSKPATQAD